MALYYHVLIFQKVAGKGGAADDVWPAVMADYIWNMGHARQYQLFADGKGNQEAALSTRY